LGEKNLSSERFFPPIITYELLYKYYSYLVAFLSNEHKCQQIPVHMEQNRNNYAPAL